MLGAAVAWDVKVPRELERDRAMETYFGTVRERLRDGWPYCTLHTGGGWQILFRFHGRFLELYHERFDDALLISLALPEDETPPHNNAGKRKIAAMQKAMQR